MGGLAHFLEDEGLATTQISLIRPQTENTKPPRALWVPFELGRPMGAPNDAAFQLRVLRAALAQPGHNTGKQMNNWFYGRTAAGKALYALWPIGAELATQRDDGFMKTFANLLLIPATQKFRAEKEEA